MMVIIIIIIILKGTATGSTVKYTKYSIQVVQHNVGLHGKLSATITTLGCKLNNVLKISEKMQGKWSPLKNVEDDFITDYLWIILILYTEAVHCFLCCLSVKLNFISQVCLALLLYMLTVVYHAWRPLHSLLLHLPHHRPRDGCPVDSATCCLISIGIGHHGQQKYQSVPIRSNTGKYHQYPITQCQYRSNTNFRLAVRRIFARFIYIQRWTKRRLLIKCGWMFVPNETRCWQKNTARNRLHTNTSRWVMSFLLWHVTVIIFHQCTLGDCWTRPFFQSYFMLGQSQAGHT